MGIFDFFKKTKKEEIEEIVDNENLDNINEDILDEISTEEITTQEKVEEIVRDLVEDAMEEGSNEDSTAEDTGSFDKTFVVDKKDENIEAEQLIEEEVIESEETTEEEIKEELEEAIQPQNEDVKKSEKMGFFKKIVLGLDKTRKNILSGVENVLSAFSKIDDELFDELEETLILSDIGAETSLGIISSVKERVKKEKVTDVSQIKGLLIEEITKILEDEESEFVLSKPSVILVIGVNGVGKTTTIGKLASNYKKDGRKVLLAAADTFRAAAIDQLEIWGQRSGIDTIKHQENSDPGAVIFDAVQAAKARKVDLLICDTAGRLHNKKNLMDELGKIFKIISQNYSEAHLEVLLVLDATTGQNALQQAKIFKEVANITGIVLTKLDGTAKGGIVIAIKNELEIPVRFVGVGEAIEDLQPFSASDFAKALFDGE